MTATPRQVVGGETVQVTWGVTEGTADFHDWLGLFVENDPKKCLRHVYVKTNKVSSQPICHPWMANPSCHNLPRTPVAAGLCVLLRGTGDREFLRQLCLANRTTRSLCVHTRARAPRRACA